ncbi:hypothetical protein L1987_80120 [Smallanthus sonchifolius]|uniref:Uncharacterized protein n=1 Tax=Smallanthus sonchifolius TaxID=185202 RepID=A0ACB8YL20_9ASTR|nr:hypothetical protein L1987_80120 [Smallanthus sonchifolius]
METLETSETLIKGLVASKPDENGNQFGGKFSHSFDLGKVKCAESAFAPLAESRCIDSYKVKGVDRVESSSHGDGSIKGISLFVELTGGVMANKPDGESIRDVKRRKLWWPGTVCDAANAPKEAANGPAREDDILVRCFGNGSFVWCSSYEVKPFVGYFDSLPNQSTAKKFLNALDIAITELGHRVKTEFTCSCLCSSMVKMDKAGHLDDLSVAWFEPAMFLDYIKDLGKGSSMPDRIDYVVKQSCLSAFYRSLGHLQIPMNQLQPENGTPSKIKTKEENGYFGHDTNGQSQLVKKPRKKWSRKIIGVQASLCSTEVLSQLQFAGQDCLFQCESKNFDSVQRFISGFRKWAFNDFSSEIPVEVLNHQVLQETLPKKVRKKDRPVILPTLGNGLNHGSLIFDFHNVGSFSFEARSMANTKTEWPANQGTIFTPMHTWNADISTLPNVNHMEGLYQAPPVFNFTHEFRSIPPYFTGHHGEPQVGLVPTGFTRVPKKRGRKRKNIDFQANPGSTIDWQANHGPTIDLQANPGSTPPYFTGNHGEPQVGLVPTGLSHVPKKRGREWKNIDLIAHPDSTMYLHANPGSVDLQVNPGSTMDLQANPGSTVDWQANPGSTMDLQANHGSTIIPNIYNQVQQDNLELKVLEGHFGDYKMINRSGLFLLITIAGSESMVPFKTPIKTPPGPKPMDSKAIIGPTMLPDLNTNSTKVQFIKRSKTIEEIRLPANDNHLSYSKVHRGIEEATGTALLLKFSPNYPLPSFQDLNLIFCKYGKLNESETRISGQNFTGQVVFLNPSTAGDAIRRLETDQPFGPALLSYRVHHLYNVQSAVQTKSPVNVSL